MRAVSHRGPRTCRWEWPGLVAKYPADQKKDLPLRPWELGEGFLASMVEAQGPCHAKITNVVVEIPTGLVLGQAGRAAKPLHVGARVCRRAGGTVRWRSRVQSTFPAARRIDYWQTSGGAIELSSVRLHDDMRP